MYEFNLIYLSIYVLQLFQKVEGKVIFIHPLHNLSVIGYDPKKIGETPVKAATLTTGGGISITPNGSGPINQFKTDIKVFKDESDAAVKKRSNNSQLSFVTLSGIFPLVLYFIFSNWYR